MKTPDHIKNEEEAQAKRLNDEVMALNTQGQYEEAIIKVKQALQIRERVLGLEHPDTATSLNDLGEIYYEQGKYDQAKPLFTRSLAIREQVLGKSQKINYHFN